MKCKIGLHFGDIVIVRDGNLEGPSSYTKKSNTGSVVRRKTYLKYMASFVVISNDSLITEGRLDPRMNVLNGLSSISISEAENTTLNGDYLLYFEEESGSNILSGNEGVFLVTQLIYRDGDCSQTFRYI